MSARITTAEAAAHLGISHEALMGLVHLACPVEPAWSCYAGKHGTRTARYRWRADLLDTWFDEVCAWRVSNAEARGGRSAGGRGAEKADTDRSPSAQSAGRTPSRRRSRKPSSDTDGTSLVVLAERHLSR